MLAPRPRSSQALQHVVAPADDAILQALLRYYYLSSQQICRLLYSAGSLTYVQTKMKILAEAGLCQRLWLPRPAPRGSAPSVYTLGRRGLNHLRALGFDTAKRFRPSEHREHSYLFLSHTLAVNDVLIGAELLCRHAPRFGLAGLLHERDLKHRPVYVEHEDGKRIGVVPDAWLDLRVDGTYQVCLVLELDRGTEEQKAWRRKVHGLIAYANGPYQEAFQTTSLTVAVATTAGQKRLLDLIRWTERELEAMKEEDQGDLFVFTSLHPDLVAPSELFLARRWYQPLGADPVALLALD